jgi:subtilisin family serine protease
MRCRPSVTTLAAGLLFGALAVPATQAAAEPAADQEPTSYLVIFNGGVSGATAESLVQAAGGSITSNMMSQIGVVVAESASSSFDETLRADRRVAEAAENLRFKGMPGTQDHPGDPVPGGGPDPSADALEPLQWDMRQIRTEQAHAIQAGSRLVDVGILDSGIDGDHVDFTDTDGSNVDCARGRDFVLTAGPGIGNPDPCTDNQYHGTHVAGTVGARANGIGMVGHPT